MAEVQEQTKAVELCQPAAGVAPLLHKIARVGSRRQEWLKEFRSVVVEAEIAGRELLFEDRHARKQSHRATLDLVGRAKQNLAFTLKKCAREAAADVLSNGEGA